MMHKRDDVPRFASLLACLILITTVLPIALTPAHAQPVTVIYVNDDATGANNGSNWTNAYTSLQSALSVATSGQEIWVAAGTYRPAGPSGDRAASFVLTNGVAIYGGFVGNESQRSQRDWLANVTILSGDLNSNDGTNFANSGENSYTVVKGVTGATLDGFTISGGNANGSVCPTNCGGGMFNSSSSPTLVNLITMDNQASFGGGVFNTNSNPTLNNVTISGNQSGAGGGGMLNQNSSSPTLTNVTISGNLADGGGGIGNFSSSSPILTNVTLSGNQARSGGGIYNDSNCNPTLTNIIIIGNQAENSGGGITNAGSSPVLTNVVISGNQAPLAGGMFNLLGSPQVRNSIVWGNIAPANPNVSNLSSTPSFAFSLVQGSGGSSAWNNIFGTNSGNNLDADPQFIAPTAASNAPTTTGDYRLQAGSPARDSGSASLTNPSTPAGDIRSVARPQGGGVDMGAFEMRLFTLTITRGTLQSTLLNTAFTQPLEVTVSEIGGAGLPNVLVNFSAPLSGASASLSTTSATTDANGRASVNATANNILGDYQVQVSVVGITTIDSFSLSNIQYRTFLPLLQR